MFSDVTSYYYILSKSLQLPLEMQLCIWVFPGIVPEFHSYLSRQGFLEISPGVNFLVVFFVFSASCLG